MIVPANAHAFSVPDPFTLFNDGVQSVVGFSAKTILNGFSSWLADGASSLVTHVTQLISASTTTDLTPGTPGFFLPTGAMLQLTTFLVLPLLLVATIGAVLHQDMRRLVRTWAVALPGAMLAAGAAVELSAVGLQVTDALCQVVTHSVDPNMQGAYANIAKTLTGPVLSESPFLAFLIATVFILGGMALWLELILRSAAIYLAVFFLPLALAGLVWPATAHWAKRMVETLVAVILSKFVIVVALSLAVRAVTTGSSADDVLAGGAIFLLASFAPFVLLRFAPIIEGAAISHLEGVSRRPVNAARSAASRAANAPNTALGALLAGHGTSGTGDVAPAARAVAGVGLAATGGQVDREFALAGAMSEGGGAPGGASASGAPGAGGSGSSGFGGSGREASSQRTSGPGASGGSAPVGAGTVGASESGSAALQPGVAAPGGAAPGGPGADND